MEEKNKETVEKNDPAYLERQVANLNRLFEINNLINSTLDMAKLLTIIMEIIKDIMNAEASTLLLYEEKSQYLVFKVALGEAGKELQEKYRIKTGQGIAGWVAQHRTTVYVNDAYNDDRFDPNFDKKTGFKTKAVICSPLLFKGKLLGVIQAINPINKSGFDDQDVILFNTFGNQCVLAVQNALFFQNAIEEERLKNELSAARAIQRSLHPEINKKYHNILISAKTIPAREVGGEFYDIFYYPDKSLGIALGDLHLKGIPGALYASIATGAFKALTSIKGDNPSVILRHAYESIRDNLGSERQTSLFYGLIKNDERMLNFASAGVGYPILLRGGIARYLRFGKDIDLKKPKNIKVKLEPGDFFIIITDGIINLKNRNGKLLGLKRVMRHLEKSYETPEEAIALLLAMMKDYTQGLQKLEDISIIAIKME